MTRNELDAIRKKLEDEVVKFFEDADRPVEAKWRELLALKYLKTLHPYQSTGLNDLEHAIRKAFNVGDKK